MVICGTGRLQEKRLKDLAKDNDPKNFPEVVHAPSPSIYSIYLLKRHLHRQRLPTEIISKILDLAEYWPRTTCSLYDSTEVSNNFRGYTGAAAFTLRGIRPPRVPRVAGGDTVLLRTAPLALRTHVYAVEETGFKRWTSRLRLKKPSLRDEVWLPASGKHPCRKIVFELLSREEGPSSVYYPQSRSHYEDSLTWFDASVERIVPEENTVEPIAWSKSEATEGSYSGETQCATHNTLKESSAGIGDSRGCRCTSTRCEHCLQCKEEDDKPKCEGRRTFSSTRSELVHSDCTPPIVVQRNNSVSSLNQYALVTWRYDDDDEAAAADGDEIARKGSTVNGNFVRKLEVGDCIALWAKGEQEPWMNAIDRVKISVFWAV